jgi:hypothetical protein
VVELTRDVQYPLYMYASFSKNFQKKVMQICRSFQGRNEKGGGCTVARRWRRAGGIEDYLNLFFLGG